MCSCIQDLKGRSCRCGRRALLNWRNILWWTLNVWENNWADKSLLWPWLVWFWPFLLQCYSMKLVLWGRPYADNIGNSPPLVALCWLQEVELGQFRFLVFHFRWCGGIVWGVTLSGGVLRSDWSGIQKIMECFLDISWHGDVQCSGHVVISQCDATVNTPWPILCYLISSDIAFMRCWASFLLCYLMPKLSPLE